VNVIRENFKPPCARVTIVGFSSNSAAQQPVYNRLWINVCHIRHGAGVAPTKPPSVVLEELRKELIKSACIHYGSSRRGILTSA